MSSKEYFNEVAGNWDKMRETFFSSNVRKAAVKAAGVHRDAVAADVGSGSGFMTEELLRHGVHVIAVDQSPEMLLEMKKRLAGSDNVDYRVGESASLPIGGESVDFAFANMYLHHVESPAAAVEEMVRILKPGGRLVITDVDEHTHEFLRTEQHDRWLGFKREDIRTWFIDAGLRDVQVDCIGEECSSTSKATGQRIAISIFIATGTKV